MAEPGILIETANPKDVTGCTRLLRQVYGPDLAGGSEGFLLQFVRDQRSNLYLGRLEEAIVAVAAVSRRMSLDYQGMVWEVEVLVVDENYRQLGIGRALLEHIRAEAGRGVCKALLIDCPAENRLGRLFLNRLRFINTGKTVYRAFVDSD